MNEKTETRLKLFFTIALIDFVAMLSLFTFLYTDKLSGGIYFHCTVHDILHIYCPGCGATRAASALLRLDLPGALRYNAAVPLGALLIALYEIRALYAAAKADFRLLIPKTWVPVAFAVFLLLQFIVRNVLLIFFSVDLIGDFI